MKRMLLIAFVWILAGGCVESEVGESPEVEPPASLEVKAHEPYTASTVSNETAVTRPAAPPSPWPPLPRGPKLEGTDISHFQDEIDWATLRTRAQMAFVYVKATEGIDLPDPHFGQNWQRADEVGLLRGAYHVFQPLDDGVEQARFFLDHVTFRSGDLRPMLDVEVRKDVDVATLLTRVEDWLETVEKAAGVPPVIYTAPRFWNALRAEGFEDHPLWVAEYGVASPTLPFPWKQWTFWQHTQRATLPGIPKEVDLDRFHGTLEELEALRLP